MQRNINFNFLGPRVWEIVPDYIKKSNSLEEIILKLYYNYGIQKTVHSGYAKGSYHKSIFYNTTFKFPCSIFYDFCVIFLFCCHTNFNQSCLYLEIFLTPVGKNHVYLQELLLG